MNKQCRFCGGKITSDAYDCEHCGKALRKRTEPEASGLTNINSWKNKSVPSWVMYLVVGFFLFCLILLFVKKDDRKNDAQDNAPSTQTDGESGPAADPRSD
ncbi:MAG: hypothetical protein P8J27_16315 [Mariniblastus sp.]|nr:hypothetical protein [Mariniblastus sp.]